MPAHARKFAKPCQAARPRCSRIARITTGASATLRTGTHERKTFKPNFTTSDIWPIHGEQPPNTAKLKPPTPLPPPFCLSRALARTGGGRGEPRADHYGKDTHFRDEAEFRVMSKFRLVNNCLSIPEQRVSGFPLWHVEVPAERCRRYGSLAQPVTMFRGRRAQP